MNGWSTPGPRSGPRVLIVEDDGDLRTILAEALGDRGHEVLCARDGADGLDVMRRGHPDIVLLDLFMPRMDGWQFRLEQRRDPRIGRIPVIAMSASGRPAARAVDADFFLAKPFSVDALIDAIDQVLETHARGDDVERGVHQERLAALGTLAAGMAHEINNPLTHVLLDLAKVERVLRAFGEQPEVHHARSLIARATEGSERIRDIVSSVGILAARKVRAQTPLDPRNAVEAILALMHHGLQARARVVTDLRETPFVMADDSSLGQVLLNLLTNAMHAIPDGDPDAHEIRVTTSTDDAGNAVIEIADTGCGIPDYLMPRIFEPFFTTKAVGEGTGLGLSITHRIVGRLGGEIAIQSQLGQGTKVRVTLPAGRGRAGGAS